MNCDSVCDRQPAAGAAAECLAEIWPQVAAIWSPANLQFRTVLAVSGGADSVALARLAGEFVRRGLAASHRFSIVHVHHGLRGKEADRDAEFVADLATDLGFDCSILQIPPEQLPQVDPQEERRDAPSRQGQGLEGWLRRIRYRLLVRRANELGARFIATAHHQDDHIETVLLRILRGTGVRGLVGIPQIRRLTPEISLVRPLLQMRRRQIESLLAAWQIDFRHDASNEDPRFARNRVRRLLPHLREQFGWPIDEVLANLATQAADLTELLERQTAVLQARTISLPRGVAIDRAGLADYSMSELVHYLQGVWLRQEWPQQAMNYATWRRLAEWLREPSSQVIQMLPGGIRAENVDGMARITTERFDVEPSAAVESGWRAHRSR